MRLELPAGQWAELRDRLNHGQAREVRRALLAAKEKFSDAADLDDVMVRAYLVSWSLDRPVTELDGADDETVVEIALEAMRRWQGKPDPKDTTEPSPTTLRALG